MPRKSAQKPQTRARARANAKATAVQSVTVNVGQQPRARRRRTARKLAVPAAPTGQLPPLMINSQAHTLGQPFQPIAAMAVPALAPAPAFVKATNRPEERQGAPQLVHTSETVRPPAVMRLTDPETGFERWGKAEELSPPMRTLPKNLSEEMEQLQLEAPAVASSSSESGPSAQFAATAAVAAPGERAAPMSSTDRDRRDRPLAMQRYPDMPIKEALKQYRADERAAKTGSAKAARPL